MDDDKLIKMVEERGVIYNRHHPDYKYKKKKQRAFEEIAEALEIPDPYMVMRRYLTLRERFVRHTRLKETTGDDRFYVPIMDKMGFLLKHIFRKKNRRSCYVYDDDDSNTMDPLQSSSVRDDPENTMELQPIFLPGKRKSEIPISPANLPSQNKRATPGHFRNIDHEFKEAIGTFHRFCKAREEQQQQEEDGTLQGFRQMIISTISNMSEAKQAKAILRVTEAVMQIKMEPED